MTVLNVTDSVKMLRETLCVAQGAVNREGKHRAAEHSARLQRLLDDCDRQRPLGPDGKHGDLHTPTCGCEVSQRIDTGVTAPAGHELCEASLTSAYEELADATLRIRELERENADLKRNTVSVRSVAGFAVKCAGPDAEPRMVSSVWVVDKLVQLIEKGE